MKKPNRKSRRDRITFKGWEDSAGHLHSPSKLGLAQHEGDKAKAILKTAKPRYQRG